MFAVCNGGGWFGQCLKIFEKQLAEKGMVLNGGFTVPMPGNHPKIHQFINTTEETYFHDEAIKVKQIKDRVLNRIDGSVETNLGCFGHLLSHVVFKPMYKQSLEGKLDVFILGKTCNGCGLCERVCPVGNVVMENGRPVWHHNCANCTSCYHLCPMKAIAFEEDDMPRYSNSEVTLSDLIKTRKGTLSLKGTCDEASEY